MKIVSLTALALAIGLSSAAQAAPINLVSDPGFESTTPSNLSAWGGTGNGVARNTQNPAKRSANPDSNAAAKFDYVPQSLQTISQTLTTTNGRTYTVSFWLKLVDTGEVNQFKFDFGSFAAQESKTNVAAFDWTEFSKEFVADAASMDLKFYAFSVDGAYYLDDVSVTEKSVPLPASLSLLGLGLFGIGLSRRTQSRG